MLTRSQLIDELAKDRVFVSERTIKRWETDGTLPRPTYEFRDNARYALYPRTQIDLIKTRVDPSDVCPCCGQPIKASRQSP
jgi:hypothetical protein